MSIAKRTVVAVYTVVAAILAKLVEHPTIVSTTKVGQWKSGFATSGQPGADLCTIGAVGTWYWVSQALLLLAAFSPVATVTIRYYQNIFGAERLVGEEDYTNPGDGPVAYMIWYWDVEIYGSIRIEVHSDQAGDDGLAAPYEYYIKY
jgi:hypothetical protein